MKKILLIAAVMGIGFANADYLYWLVSENPVDGYNWSTAKVLQETTVIDTQSANEMADIVALDTYAMAQMGNYTDSTSFFIELYNAQDQVIARSNLGTASSLRQYISTGTFDPPIGVGFMPAAGSFQAVPEPTSGLLFLVGGMLLGLRRKRRV